MRRPVTVLLPFALQAHAYDARLCDKGSYTPPNGDFTYVPNAWNADNNGGFSCVTVRNTPPTLDATWRWSSDRGEVHSYPHVQFTHPALPTPLWNISALTVSTQWSMGPGSKPRSIPSIDSSGLARLDVSANVAFDLFADRNAARAQEETKAETEIMIWLGRVGQAQPLGYNDSDSCCAKVTVGHVEFTLYQGTNQRGTLVYTWAAESNETSFGADISPLLQYLWRTGLVSAESYLGLVGFGSEGYHAEENVTFSMKNYDMDVLVAPAPTLSIGHFPTASPTSASPTPASAAGRLDGSWRSAVPISGMVSALLLLF